MSNHIQIGYASLESYFKNSKTGELGLNLVWTEFGTDDYQEDVEIDNLIDRAEALKIIAFIKKTYDISNDEITVQSID